MSGRRGPGGRTRWWRPVPPLLLPVAAMVLAVHGAGCASTMSESEPAASRSPHVVGLEPVPIASPSSPEPPSGAADRRAVIVTGAPIAGEREAEVAATPGSASASIPPAAGLPAPSSPACDARVGPRAIRRTALIRTLDAGLGAWLRGVDVEGKVDHGHFQGWLVRSIYSGDPCWSDVDLLPGDVVTRINRRPIERPEEAQAVWTALRTATEILVELTRDGRPRALKFVVVDPAADGPRRPR